MKKLLRLISALALLIVPFVTTPVMVMASAKTDILTTVNSTDPGSSNVESAVQSGIILFTVIVGITAVVMMIFGGYKYITSGGDPGKTASAKSTIIYALIGVVLVALSQLLLRLVIGKARANT